ncbi:hypothetical protein Agub_g2921, partial [Astrephomene gubernaculifera]
GSLVVVGDLMRSLSLLSYSGEQGLLELRAADYNSGWTTAVEALDDDTYIAADNHCNMYVVRRNADSATDEERARLEVVGEFHSGSLINRFRSGSLVMRLPDSELASQLPQLPLLAAGTDGRLAVVARLPPALYDKLNRMQSAMRQVVRGVGGLSHEPWRAFANDRRTTDSRGFVDGDLIETFLDLGPEDAARVAALMSGGGGGEGGAAGASSSSGGGGGGGAGVVSVDELTRLVEELARALH